MTTIIILVFITLLVIVINRRNSTISNYDYKCNLLTLKKSTKRRKKFLKYHNPSIPLEITYGVDTTKLKNARDFEHLVDPEYFEKAVEMHYDKTVKRPDITYFNMGAIGAYMGHTNLMKNATSKYILILEDNVIIKSNQFYNEVQDVIDKLGDNFEMCFFHCLSRIPTKVYRGLERVEWISSMKCYLVHTENMKKYMKYYFPIDNHVDNKTEDVIAKGARVYYKDLRRYIKIDRSGPSTIGHSDHGRREFFSRQNPTYVPDDVLWGY
jgi:GR25 family glycosyltransferase involved in LPS biosynthesis